MKEWSASLVELNSVETVDVAKQPSSQSVFLCNITPPWAEWNLNEFQTCSFSASTTMYYIIMTSLKGSYWPVIEKLYYIPNCLCYVCPKHSLTHPPCFIFPTSSPSSRVWKKWLNHAEAEICFSPQTLTQPSGTQTSSLSLWVDPHTLLTHTVCCLNTFTAHKWIHYEGFTSLTGEHPNQDLWDGERSRGRPQVHRGVCSTDCWGVWRLQDCHREEHGPSPSCWEH